MKRKRLATKKDKRLRNVHFQVRYKIYIWLAEENNYNGLLQALLIAYKDCKKYFTLLQALSPIE